MAFVIPYTYVFDRDGDKIRTVQFRAAGIIAPTSLFFGANNRVLVAPGLYEFSIWARLPGSNEPTMVGLRTIRVD